MARLVLKPGKERSLTRRHPWIFSGAVARLEGAAGPGDTVEVLAADGAWLARAALSPASNIRARVWTFDRNEAVDEAFFRRRIAAALAARPVVAGEGVRLVHGESDGLPGLVVDRYDTVLVAQFLATGAERWRDTIADVLLEATGLAVLYERSDADVRALEGLPERCGELRGALPSGELIIRENGVAMAVDVAAGHKTGFYLDQRDNLALARALAQARPGAVALNCFCYTGGFSLALAAGGAASVLSIDSSAPALATARANVRLNGMDEARFEWREADVFAALRELARDGRRYDIVILDPPKFAPTPASVERAARAYKDINLIGMRLIAPGGHLLTFSCSGGVSAELFQKIVAGAAADAGVDMRIRARLMASSDHPVRLAFPEGEYLKGLHLARP